MRETNPEADMLAAYLQELTLQSRYPEKDFLVALDRMISLEPESANEMADSLAQVCLARGLPYPTDPAWRLLSAELDERGSNAHGTSRSGALEDGIVTCMAFAVLLAATEASSLSRRECPES